MLKCDISDNPHNIRKMMKNLTESLLPQPPSFVKKKSYDVQQVLGKGTFGKVMVRSDLDNSAQTYLTRLNQLVVHYSGQRGMFLLIKSQ